MDSFYLSPELQSFIIIGQRVLFSFSIVLNMTAFVCLLKETPENQSRFRNYLLYIQVLAAMNDINLDVLFEPFPLFPILGAICNGVLCRLGIVYSMPGIVSFSVEFDGSHSEDLIDHFPYGNLSWIRQRGMMYELFEKTREIMVVPIVTISVLIIANVLLLFMIQRIAASILSDTVRSERTAKRNRRALIVLLIQLGVPVLFLIVPSTIMMVSIIWETLLPFKFCLLSFHFITLHTTVHSLVLLLITPAYRPFIRYFLIQFRPKIFYQGRIQPTEHCYRESHPVHVIDLSTVKAT